jgi:protocatechuate 3,4-dioxygenase beta subunit
MISTRSPLAVVVLLVLSSCAHAQSTASIEGLITNHPVHHLIYRPVFAQAGVADSTVKGRITDQSGAGVGQVMITVINVERGVARTVKTDDAGAYRVPLLQPGTYELRVEAAGFQPQVLQSVVLTVGEVAIRDV